MNTGYRIISCKIMEIKIFLVVSIYGIFEIFFSSETVQSTWLLEYQSISQKGIIAIWRTYSASLDKLFYFSLLTPLPSEFTSIIRLLITSLLKSLLWIILLGSRDWIFLFLEGIVVKNSNPFCFKSFFFFHKWCSQRRRHF